MVFRIELSVSAHPLFLSSIRMPVICEAGFAASVFDDTGIDGVLLLDCDEAVDVDVLPCTSDVAADVDVLPGAADVEPALPQAASISARAAIRNKGSNVMRVDFLRISVPCSAVLLYMFMSSSSFHFSMFSRMKNQMMFCSIYINGFTRNRLNKHHLQ